jgi:segregation and condensation protein A
MARLTEQYLEYVELMRQKSLELASEYLLMAAVLIEIKSRMLLPRPPAVSQDENDPRAELMRRLLAYEQMKLAAQRLDELPQAGRDFALVQVWVDRAFEQTLPNISAEDLRHAWLWLLMRANVNQPHRVTRDQLSVREHMTLILRRLQDSKFLEFTQLFSPSDGISKLVVTFLAILELTRETLIEVTQQEPFTPIYVKLTHGLTIV